jgi:hypothetical protein
MAASRTLSELVVVREWLHDTAPPPPHPDASTGYWRFTKHRVTQGLWTGNTGRAADSVVREMDPDSVVREAEAGRSLAADDAVRYDLPLVLLVGSDVISSRATTRHWHIHFLLMSARGTSKTRSSFVAMRISPGARQLSAALFFFLGLQYVSPHVQLP